MAYYFGVNSESSLQFFGVIHVLCILLTILSVFLVYKFRNKLKKNNFIPNIIVGVLLINILVYVIGGILGGEFDKNFHIPLQYCYITGFFFIYSLLFKKEKIFNFLYYAIFFCTTSVIIFMDPGVSYDRYHFVLLIVSHHFLLVSSFYALYVLKYNVNKKGILYFFIYSSIVYTVVYIINYIFDTTYIFKESLPLFMYEYFPFINNIPTIVLFLVFSVPTMIGGYYLTKLNNKGGK